MTKNNRKSEQGMALIVATIVMVAIGSITAFSVLYFANNAIKNSRTQTRSNQAKGMTNACAESGIQRIIATPTYTGTTTVTVGSNSCTYIVTQPTATTSLIVTSATVSGVVRKSQVTMSRAPVSVTRWEEIQ